jgi:ketosteroid isomerase-like protein
MSPRKPEEWPTQFEQELNAGDLEGAVALYEADACVVSESGETAVGRDGVRLMPSGLIARKARLQGSFRFEGKRQARGPGPQNAKPG